MSGDDEPNPGPETLMEDAIRTGLTHLHIRCHHCPQVTSIPWNLLPDMLSALKRPIGQYAGRLRCSRCKHYPPCENISAWSQSLTAAYRAGSTRR